MIETKWQLFQARAGEDAAQVWLEPMGGGGVVLRTQEWGPGVERAFGLDTVGTSLRIGPVAVSTLAFALVMDRPELDLAAAAPDVLAEAYRGDDDASAHARRRLEELGLPYEFSLG